MSQAVLYEKFLELLVEAQEKRPKLQKVVVDPCGHDVPEWVIYEREVLLRATNEEREGNRLEPISLRDFVRKAEQPACGHVDYSRKFALYSSELAVA